MIFKKLAAFTLAAVTLLSSSASALGTEIYSSSRPIGIGTRLNEYIYDYSERQNEHFIEYTPNASREDLVLERRGADFFNASAKSAQLFIYKEDRDYFLGSFTKENVMRMLDEQGHFTLTYRLQVE